MSADQTPGRPTEAVTDPDTGIVYFPEDDDATSQTAPGRPTEQEWAEEARRFAWQTLAEARRVAWQTLADHQWRDWQCSCGKVRPEAREYEDNHLSDVLASTLTPLIARVEAAARAEGAASVAGPVLALADEWEYPHQPYAVRKEAAPALRTAIPTDATEALAQVKADAWDEGFQSDYEGDGWPPNPYRIAREAQQDGGDTNA